MTIVCIAGPVVDRIGYFEAWRLWFGGEQPPSDAVLWFISLRWWARAGKIAAFLGGATVILDLLGPERLREYGRAGRRFQKELAGSPHVKSGREFFILVIVGHALAALLWIFAPAAAPIFGFFGSLTFLVAALTFPRIGRMVIEALDREQPAQAVRYVGLLLLFVGFHFDLLSS